MADADEDVIPRSTPSSLHNTQDPDYDPEDEAQDFRFLASLTGINTTLPKRGEKDFEPNPTKAQQNVLNASRQAMYNALAVERVHPAKNTCTGVYLPNSEEWWHDEGTDKTGPGARCVVVEKFRGVHNKSLGKEDFRNWTWLLPEEALFLLERGSLDIRWPDEGQQNVIVKTLVEDEEDDSAKAIPTNASAKEQGKIRDCHPYTGDTAHEEPVSKKGKGEKFAYSLRMSELPMSLQGAYACLIGKNGLRLERYTTYAGLRRLGYVVQRAPTWDNDSEPDGTSLLETPNPTREPEEPDTQKPSDRNKDRISTSLVNRLMSWILQDSQPSQFNTAHGPLIRPGAYRNYNDIFKALTLIPAITPTATAQLSKPKPPFNIHFTILKPSSLSTYRKSSPPTPDFLISVLNARTTTTPTLSQIGELLDSLPESILPKEKRMETRLKHGRRNVLLAVVYCGIVSYLRVADMAFAELGRVHEEKVRRGTKGAGSRGRGGGRGGRGGGQGRGRGS